MPFSKRLVRFRPASLSRIIFFIHLSLFIFSSEAFCLQEKVPIHFSGNKQVWDRRKNVVELFGNAVIKQPGEVLTANYIRLNLNTRDLDALVNCVYIASETVISSDEMHFNLKSRTGTIHKGRVSNDRFSLRADKIVRLGEGHFETTEGEYTTCVDCSPSWSLRANHVDMEVDGYAYLSGVVAKIKDTPAFWLPFLVVPMKTQRQSGVLFPKFAFSGVNGATFILPFYWAINRSSDMTLGAGEYTLRGHRLEWEGRYALTHRSTGVANAYYLTDRQFRYTSQRWAFRLAQIQELPWNLEAKVRLNEVSDNIYPFQMSNDFSNLSGEAFLPSTFTLSRASSSVSGYLSLQRYRNLLNSTPGDSRAQNLDFDPRAVQAFPSIMVTTQEKHLWDSPLIGGLTIGATRFTRPRGSFDLDQSSQRAQMAGFDPNTAPTYVAGQDPLRRATRLSITPSLYTTFRPFDVVSIVPSVQYRGYYYNFNGFVPDLTRGYLIFQTDLTAQLQKIYDYPDDPDVPRAKHLIRPLLTYSWIPVIRENSSHPFVAQIKNAQSRNIYGYNFDDQDIVPYSYNQLGANYFVPQGNSLAYGFTTQWIRKKTGQGIETPSYQSVFEWSAGQAINFLEIYQPENYATRHIFTRFFSNVGLNLGHISSQTTYYYYPDIPASTPRHTVTTGLSYIFQRSLHQNVLTYDRSLSLNYTFNKVSSSTSNLSGTVNFSLSDYVLPFGNVNYSFKTSDIQPNQLLGAGFGVNFQNPSRCWKFTIGTNYVSGQGVSTNFDLALNLTGKGFGGMSEIANQAMSR